MNKGDFFVMLITQKGDYTPMLRAADESAEGELAKFETEEAARGAAKETVLGDAFGFEVFERGYGCSHG